MENNIETSLNQFFAKETTTDQLLVELNEATRILYDAVSYKDGTSAAIDAVSLLSSTAKLVELITKNRD